MLKSFPESALVNPKSSLKITGLKKQIEIDSMRPRDSTKM